MDTPVSLAWQTVNDDDAKTDTEGNYPDCEDDDKFSCAATEEEVFAEDIPERGMKRKRKTSNTSLSVYSREESRSPDMKTVKYCSSPPSPPSTSCDREVSIILTQPPHSSPSQYSATSSLHTDLAITPSPLTTTQGQDPPNQAEKKFTNTRIVQPKYLNLITSSVEDSSSLNSTLYSSPIISSPMCSSSIISSPAYPSPIIGSPLYSPHSPAYSIPSPGSAFSIVSPRRRLSCESEKETVLEGSELEMGGESNEVKDTTIKDSMDNITVDKKFSDESSMTLCEEKYS